MILAFRPLLTSCRFSRMPAERTLHSKLTVTVKRFPPFIASVRNMALSASDPNSFSNPEEAIVKSYFWDVAVDFDKKVISGYVDLDVVKNAKNAEFILLDSSIDLNIKRVTEKESGAELETDRTQTSELFGVCTKIRLPGASQPVIRIEYETSPSSTALQWMTKEQTAGKKYPFLFSQSEAIHARALFPCQDSPNVKSSFTAKVRVPDTLTALLSAVRTGEEVHNDGTKSFSFSQKIPVPSYLLAIAVGDLKSRKIGPISHVWAEEELVDKAVVDFADTDIMVSTAAKLMGDYVWGIYDLLVLPPSFPFGGMENPCLTFMTPTTLAGDKSLANVVAHEIAHSWTGNLVTNKTFEHFWLNEGFTVYTERKILGCLYDEDFRQFAAIEGLKCLKYAIQSLGATSPLTKLVVNLDGVHPDDSFSSIPYEKGHTFLFYLETLLGREAMDDFMRAYVKKFQYKSIVTDDWHKFMYEFFADKKDILDKVDWNAWLHAPGMPPVIPEYKSKLSEPSCSLCTKWRTSTLEEVKCFTADEYEKLTPLQRQVFFAELLDGEIISEEKIIHLTQLYSMESVVNSEIRFRWLRLGLLSKWEGIIKPTTDFLECVGRMKFVAPLFSDMAKWPEKRQFAIDFYEKLKPTMMHFTRHAVEKALKL